MLKVIEDDTIDWRKLFMEYAQHKSSCIIRNVDITGEHHCSCGLWNIVKK